MKRNFFFGMAVLAAALVFANFAAPDLVGASALAAAPMAAGLGLLANQGQACAAPQVYAVQSAANTAAATSGWIDCKAYEGDVMVTIATGAITGSLTVTFQDATDGAGTGAAAIVPNEGNPAVINSANQVRKVTFNASAIRSHLQIVGTVVTGPVLVAYTVHAHPKYSA